MSDTCDKEKEDEKRDLVVDMEILLLCSKFGYYLSKHDRDVQWKIYDLFVFFGYPSDIVKNTQTIVNIPILDIQKLKNEITKNDHNKGVVIDFFMVHSNNFKIDN